MIAFEAKGFKGWVHCFSMQAVKTSVFSYTLKKFWYRSVLSFSRKLKKRITPPSRRL